MRKLSEAEVSKALEQLPGWERQGNTISRMFDRRTFQGAIAFVNTLSELAERAEHHPDMEIRFSRVKVFLTTHDAGALTDQDIALARQISAAAD